MVIFTAHLQTTFKCSGDASGAVLMKSAISASNQAMESE